MRKNIFFALFSLCIGALAVSLPSAVSAQSKTGTTGQASAVSTSLVISQVYSGGGGANGTYMHDYVEIKNISGTSQSLNGLKIAYASATGQFASSAGNFFTLPDVSIAPGQYYLVQVGNAGGGGDVLPVTPDSITGNINMGAANGKVALVTADFANNTCGATATPCTLPNSTILDLVSWGTANNAEGGTAVGALSATSGAVRKEAGCLDTDNNGADFDVTSPSVPRNTASTYTACGTSGGGPTKVPMDFDGDGYTDYAVIRVGETQPDWLRWYVSMNQSFDMQYQDWGTTMDTFVPADYDGDGKTDYAIWRPGETGTFYIINSSDFTLNTQEFGQSGDDPTVVADYDGDGKVDIAVYREALGEDYSYWYWKTGPNEYYQTTAWGLAGDRAMVGDFDGDGKSEPAIIREGPNGENEFWIRYSTENYTSFTHGEYNDILLTGDYTGDGIDDIVLVSVEGGLYKWSVRPSEGGADIVKMWGVVAEEDIMISGDYNGDGVMDFAVWRPGAETATFWAITMDEQAIITRSWGTSADVPVGIYNVR